MGARKRVLSGHRPTGALHLGHLVGALSNWIQMQDEFECFFTIVDWHALTTGYLNPTGIRGSTIDTVVDWMAAGLDPARCTMFVQSDVKEHAEMHLLLSMITPLPWLERVPTYKEQQQQLADRDINTYGFLGYPVLQAADIVLYAADFVPVGEDQLPHIELTREIVRRFNQLYGPVLVEPAARTTRIARLPGTDGRKMSKSYGNSIDLSDSPEAMTAKISKMMTDPARARRYDPGNPDVCPVFALHRAFTPETRLAEIDAGCRSAALGCVDCKADLAARLRERFEPFHERRREILKSPDTVRDVLADGAKRARAVASQTLHAARKAMGLGHER
ncbi:MAG: tryptophan--tRNA ligase [Acidobacteria bacterium]|nr:tryptophan--tRNA ligase [Acidobacteriota bacterium]